MNRFIIVISVTFLLCTTSSCVKSYVCACTYNDGTEEVTSTTEYTTAESAAQESCSQSESDLKTIYSDATCSLN